MEANQRNTIRSLLEKATDSVSIHLIHAEDAPGWRFDLQGRVPELTVSADYPVRHTYDATDGWMLDG